MAKFNIIDAVSGAVKYSGTPKYTGSYCKVSVLEFNEIASPTKIDWKVGDYVVYNGTGRTGLTYRLFDIPQPKKQARNSEYGGSYIYSNVQFFPATKWLELEPFRDVVLADNDIHFSTRESWSVWASVADLVERLQAVMDEARPNEWVFRLVSATSGSDLYNLLHNNYQDFTISGESVLGGLDKIYNQWGNIGWLHTYENIPNVGWRNVVTLGIPPTRVSGIGTDASGSFVYGKGNGLLSLKKTLSNRDELRTRLFVYGSTRNMVPRYYNNLTPAIKDNDSVDIQHLMIPLDYWGTTSGKKDASKAYIENNTALYGVRPDTVYFDGSDDLPEIYPSLAETTIGQLYDSMASGSQYRPDLDIWDRDDRLDEVVSASGILDDGSLSSDGKRYAVQATLATIPTNTNLTEEFSNAVISNYSIPYTGTLKIALRGLQVTVTDTQNYVVGLNLRLVVKCGASSATYRIDWLKRVGTFVGTLPDIDVNCRQGETLNVSIAASTEFREPISGTYPVSINLPATTAELGFAAERTNDFVIRVPQIGFDIASRAALGSQGLATIAMLDGMCGGRSFVVKSAKYDATNDAWDLTLYRGKDDSLDMLFPNTTFPIASGDHYVLLDIAMPDTYVLMAEQKLYAAGQELLADVSRIRPFYEPEVDAKFMTDNSRALREGWYMAIQDADIIGAGLTEYVLIDTIVIAEGESEIPTYKVTLREQKSRKYTTTGTSSGYALTSLAGSSTGAVPTSDGLTLAQKTLLENLDSWFGIDDDGNIFVKKDEDDNPRSFYAYGEVTAGGIGSGEPTGATTLGGLLNVVDTADDVQTVDKILVRRANASGGDSWTLANLSDISGTVVGVKMNGVVKNPGTDKIVDLGTVLTEHQSLAAYRTSANQDAIDDLIRGRLTAIEGLIPSDATTQNPLADKSFVNSSIATATATFRGTSASGLTEAQFLAWANGLTKDNNDYVFWNTTDSAGNVQFKRYKYNGTSWAYEYTLNNSSFTAAQWSAVNSGITSSLVTAFGNKYDKPSSGIPLADLAQGVKDSLALADSALQSHQSIYALTVQKNGTTVGTYTPNSAAKTINITDVASAQTLSDLKTWIESMFEKDTTSVSGTTLIKAKFSLYSEGEITAGGVGSGGGGGAAVWGGITGTLSNQTDLMAALNGKQPSLGSGSEGQILKWVSGSPTWAAAPATGVTSLGGKSGAIGIGSGLSVTSANTLTNTGVLSVGSQTGAITLRGGLTANGSVNLAMSGTQLQASIVGLGSLAYLNGLSKSDVGLGNVENVAALPKQSLVSNYSVWSDSNWGFSQWTPSSQGAPSPYGTSLNFRDRTSWYFRLMFGVSPDRIYFYSGINTTTMTNRGTLAYLSDIPTSLSQLTADANHRLVTDTQITNWTTAYNWGNHANAGYASASSLGNYLPLTGGTLSGASYGLLGLDSTHQTSYSGMLWFYNKGTKWGGLSCVGQDNLCFTNAAWSANYTIYHSGNCNNTSTPWRASTLTLNGAISGATTVTASSHIYTGGYLYSSKSGTNRTVIDFLNTGEPLFGYGTCGASLDTHIYGNIIGFHTSSSRGERMRIDASGNVGIGTASPTAKLSVMGNSYFRTDITGASINIDSPTYTGGWNGGLHIYEQGNKAGSAISWYASSSGIGYIRIGNFGSTYDNPAIYITSDGNVMIGAASNMGQKLYVAGNIVATGEVSAAQPSDSRFKNNQRSLRNADAVLKALRPMEFDWNELYHSLGGRNEGHDVGFLAQDIQPLIPSAIGKVYGDYLRLDYNKVTPYLVAGWQSHETRIERLERENAELKMEIQRLRS